MTRDEIKQIALNAWFELQLQEDGTLDLPQHVYDFAYALLANAEPTQLSQFCKN